ncbi:MAG: hypothetical protein CMJ46_04060 [Planctomyces sp.]|nr:hypothetical protein [Planctomyces sp.]
MVSFLVWAGLVAGTLTWFGWDLKLSPRGITYTGELLTRLKVKTFVFTVVLPTIVHGGLLRFCFYSLFKNDAKRLAASESQAGRYFQHVDARYRLPLRLHAAEDLGATEIGIGTTLGRLQVAITLAVGLMLFACLK